MPQATATDQAPRHTASATATGRSPKQRFVCFMRGRSGRLARAGLGVALIAIGLALVGGTAGTIVAAFGLLPIASGATGVCPLGPLFGTDFRGRERNPVA